MGSRSLKRALISRGGWGEQPSLEPGFNDMIQDHLGAGEKGFMGRGC